MIINTGVRTDIPAFYSSWLLNRIREGFVYVRNPFNYHSVSAYRLDPKLVDCLCFCSKNPHPLLSHFDILDKFHMYWFVTITPYGRDIEPHVPDKRQVIEDFKVLSFHLGKKSVALRYDPILFNQKFDVSLHIKAFGRLLSQLKGYTEDVTISFLDVYPQMQIRARDLLPPTLEEEIKIVKAFSQIAKDNDMVLHTCCENPLLRQYGADVSGCLSRQILEKSLGFPLKDVSHSSKRDSCSCMMGNDIGMYDSCLHLCRYCYAEHEDSKVKENYLRHDPSSPFLLGHLEKEDKITWAKQESYKIEGEQLSLF